MDFTHSAADSVPWTRVFHAKSPRARDMRKGFTDSSQTEHSEWFASEDTARHWQHTFTTSCLIRAASQWTSQDFTNADSQPPLRALLIAANVALRHCLVLPTCRPFIDASCQILAGRSRCMNFRRFVALASTRACQRHLLHPWPKHMPKIQYKSVQCTVMSCQPQSGL